MNDIEAVKQRLDIVDYIGNKVQLKQAGRNFKGACPFHHEKTPSFMVNPDLQIFKCFGCGESGDVFSFIEKYEGVEFGEALKMAAEHIGYTLQGNFNKDDAAEKEKSQIYEVNRLATEYWHYILNTHAAGKAGREYAQKRSIRQQEIETFKLGFAPQGTNLLPFLAKKGFAPQKLVEWGLAIDRDGDIIDKFRGRLMLPIYNLRGQVIGFSGRITYQSEYAPKYLNSSETLVYKKSEILMGLFQAKDASRYSKTLILEEGNLDLMASHKVDVKNICATGGTAITPQQIRLIKRYADKVIFCFDSDGAGLKALLKGIELAEKANLEHAVIELGDYQDPDDLIQHEPELWPKLVAEPTNSYEYLFKRFAVGLDLGSATGKSKFTKLLVPILKLIEDKVQQSHFIKQLAMTVDVSSDIISNQVQSTSSATPIQLPASVSNQRTNNLPANLEKTRPSVREQYLLALLAANTQPIELLSSAEMLIDTDYQAIFTAIQTQKQTKASYATLSDKLTNEQQQILQTILTWDLNEESENTNLMDQISKLDKLIYESWLRREILSLRSKLDQSPEDEQTLVNLRTLTTELNSLTATKSD